MSNISHVSCPGIAVIGVPNAACMGWDNAYHRHLYRRPITDAEIERVRFFPHPILVEEFEGVYNFMMLFWKVQERWNDPITKKMMKN